MSHGYGEARPIGRMVPGQPARTARRQAACAKCGARLSQYRNDYETTCAPCQLAKGSWRDDTPPDPAGESSAERARKAATPTKATKRQLTVEEKAADWRYDACACGRGMKRTDRQRCRDCYNDARRVPGARWSATCACGGKKSKGAEMCMRCRYGIIAA